MRKIILAVLSTCLAGLTSVDNTAPAGTLRVVHQIGFPTVYSGQLGVDLAWDGEHLWTAFRGTMPPDTFKAATAEFDPADGSIVSTIPSDPATSSLIPRFDPSLYRRAFTWDGAYLWGTGIAAGRGGNDMLGVVASDLPSTEWPSGRTLPYSPEAHTQGAAWDGDYFWFSDREHDVIMRVATTPLFAPPHSGPLLVLDLYSFPGSEPLGLAWDGSSLWCVDGSDGLIYQMDRSGNLLETWSSPATDPFGLTFDGEYLWLLDNGTKQIFQLAVPEPSTLAFLGVAAAAFIPVALRSRAAGRRGRWRRNGKVRSSGRRVKGQECTPSGVTVAPSPQ